MSSVDTLSSLLDERARQEGDRVFAFFSSAQPVTLSDHWRRSERLAAGLVGKGAGKGSRVILLGATSPQLLGVLAACWRIGALVCPAEAFLAREGLAKIVALFRPNLAVVDASLEAGRTLASLCQERDVLVVSIEQLDERPSRYAGGMPSPDDPALCIFTSGSTGTPKGVVLSHSNLISGAHNVVAAKGIGPDDRVLCVLPMSHLNGLETTFVTPLVSGGSVVYLQGAFQPLRALQLLDQHECTWFSAVPTQYAYLLKPPVPLDNLRLGKLRFCRSASAPLPVRVRKEFEQHYGVPIIETMGMTETSGQIFSNPMPPESPREGSVGRPIGFQIRIAGENEEVLGPDQLGEIQIKGPAIMLGYLDNPDETKRAFSGDWLRSGDLGSYDQDGFYYIRGRIKDIAIFSGVNISLRAIEADVQEAGIVDDIACIGSPDHFFGETVTAYVVPRTRQGDPALIADQVSARLRGILPSPQALKEVRVVDRFLRNSAGKVLKGRMSEVPVLFSTVSEFPREARALVAYVLRLPESAISEDLGLGLVKQWDSLAHVTLVLAVETLMDRSLTQTEIIGVTTLKGIRAVLDGTFDGTSGSLLDLAEAERAGGTRGRQDLISLMIWNGLLPDVRQSAFASSDRVATQAIRRLSFKELTEAFKDAGLRSGDSLLLHSDLSTIGLVEEARDREGVLDFFLRALKAVLGTEGTLTMCTSFEDYGRYGTTFEWESSPSRLGALSEHLRVQPNAVRSIHPIVSVTGLGPRAEEFCGGDDHFDGFGYDSPWGRLHRANAKLMTLGMGRYPEMGLTFLHFIEHAFGVPYQYTKIYEAPVLKKGTRLAGPFTMSVRYLDYGITYNTNRFKNELLAAGMATHTAIGGDSIFCTTASKAMDFGISRLRKDRYYFLKETPRFRCGEIPMDGATGELQYVYDKAIPQAR